MMQQDVSFNYKAELIPKNVTLIWFKRSAKFRFIVFVGAVCKFCFFSSFLPRGVYTFLSNLKKTSKDKFTPHKEHDYLNRSILLSLCSSDFAKDKTLFYCNSGSI